MLHWWIFCWSCFGVSLNQSLSWFVFSSGPCGIDAMLHEGTSREVLELVDFASVSG